MQERFLQINQRQVEQEALALGQRQGRVRDTSTAAGVAGRLSEARRADEAQDLMAAQQLLGQQQAMQQARTAEECNAWEWVVSLQDKLKHWLNSVWPNRGPCSKWVLGQPAPLLVYKPSKLACSSKLCRLLVD